MKSRDLKKFYVGGATNLAEKVRLVGEDLFGVDLMWLKSQIESLTERVNEIQAIISSDNQAIFVTPGSFTFNVPSGVTSVTVQCQGAGGSGAGVWERHGDWGAGAGGGSGAYAKAIIAVTPNSGILVTIGAGGASVSGEALGIAGGTTSFGSYITCTGGGGGGGGRGPDHAEGGAAGIATVQGVTQVIQQLNGNQGTGNATRNNRTPCPGGASPFFTGYGAGGQGVIDMPSGAGQNGIIIVTW